MVSESPTWAAERILDKAFAGENAVNTVFEIQCSEMSEEDISQEAEDLRIAIETGKWGVIRVSIIDTVILLRRIIES